MSTWSNFPLQVSEADRVYAQACTLFGCYMSFCRIETGNPPG